MERLISIVGWDGTLPVLVAATPWLVRLGFPAGHLAEVVVAILLPIALALLRVHLGQEQLVRVCCGGPTWRRQLTLGVSISLLLLFEIAVMILYFAKDAPQSAWLAPLFLYSAYVITIWIALRPTREETCLST